MRQEKQGRLKDRVVHSKSIVDNSKAIEDKRARHQEEFKRNLQEKKQTYQQDLERRLNRVYSKPLMLEVPHGKAEKYTMNRSMKENINEVMFNNSEDQSN